MSLQHYRRLSLTALALATVTCAWAEGAQDLQFRAALGATHDSNLFRLPKNADTQAILGKSSAAENITTKTLGVHYDRSYSLQRVELDMSVNDYRYQNFSYLDFTAYNYNAAWRWSYTPHLYGNVTASREQSLNSFADFQGFNQRNVRVNTNMRADALYELDARWRVLGALNRSTLRNSAPLTQEPDYNYTAADAGVRYELPSGSSAGYNFRSTDGTYTTNRFIPSAGFYDNGFTQTDNDASVIWAVSRDTSAGFRAGYRSRKHPNYDQRNFGGVTGGADLRWNFSPKTLLVAGWSRELGTYETSTSNYAQSDRFFLAPVWQISPKTSVRLRLDHEQRDYRGTPTGVTALQRRDTMRDTSVSINWQPVNSVILNASLQNARRSSNLKGLDYNSNGISVTAQFTY